MPVSPYTARPTTRAYRLLHDRRAADDRWSARQDALWDGLNGLAKSANPDDREQVHRLKIAVSDGEGEWACMWQERLLLAVGTLCMQNERPDIWRQVYEAWDEMAVPGGEKVLLDELAAKARRGEI